MLAYGYSCTTWTSHILVGIWNIASVRDNAYDCDILSRDEEYEGLLEIFHGYMIFLCLVIQGLSVYHMIL